MMRLESPGLIIRVCLLLPVLALFGSASAAMQAEPLLSLTFGPSYDLQADGDRCTVRAPVTFRQGVKAGDLTLTKSDLEFNQVHNKDLLDAFKVEMQDAGGGQGPAILITADMTKVTHQGTYTLRLTVTGKDGKPLPLELKLVRPAAKLRAPIPLIIEQVQPFILGDIEDIKQDVSLKETSGRSRISRIRIEQVGIAGDSERQTKEKIEFDPFEEGIPPNELKSASYKLTGPFPLGTTKGSAEIFSPQLAEAVPLSFEVRARRSRWAIVVFLVLGFMIGCLLRTKLQQQIALDEARLKGLELQTEIKHVQQKHKDADFREKLEEILKELDLKLGEWRLSDMLRTQNRAAQIAAAITAANTKFEAAQKDLQERRTAAQTMYGELKTLVDTEWLIPSGVAEQLKSLDGPLQQSRTRLDADNIRAAADILKSIAGSLAGKLSPPTDDWRNGIIVYLELLGNEDTLLPPHLRNKINESAATLKLVINTAVLDSGSVTAAALKTFLQALDRSWRGAQDLMEQLASSLKIHAEDVDETLRQHDPQDEAALEALSETVAETAGKLRANVAQPGKAAEELPNDLTALDAVWRRAVTRQIPSAATADEKKSIDKDLSEQHYLDAAREVVRIIIRLETPDEAAHADIVQPLGVPMAPESTAKDWQLPGEIAFKSSPLILLAPDKHNLSTYEDLLVSTWRSLLAARLLRTLLVGLAITGVGFFLFHDNFVGTEKDLAAIFFWAFSLDVTVDALLQKIPALTKKG